MSNTIREYEASIENFPDAKNLSVTATMQGNYGSGVQMTIGNEYIVLAENQVKDLIKILQKRLRRDKGYSATDTIEPKIINAKKR